MKRVTKMKMALMVMACLLMGQIFAQDTTTLSGTVTLDQCIAIAIKNNLQINNNRVTADVNQQYVREAFGNFLPNISGSIGHSLSEGRAISSVSNTYVTQSSTYANYGLNFNEILWNAGSIRNNYSANRYGYEASKMDIQTQKDNISIQVILAYLQVLSYEEQLGTAKQQVESNRQQVEKSQNMLDAGALSNPADLASLKAILASSEIGAINAQKALESNKIFLVQLLNVPYSPNFELEKIADNVEPVTYDANPDNIYDFAVKNLSIIKAGQLRVLSQSKYLKSAKGSLWPTLSFGSSAGTSFSSLGTDLQGNKIAYVKQLSNNFGSTFGLNLSIPILNAFRGQAQVKMQQIYYNQAKFNDASNRTALQQNVQQAYINVTSGFQSYQKGKEQVDAYSEAARIAQVRFNEGVTTSADYIVNKTNLDVTQLNLIATKYDYILRTKILDYYQGKLTFK